MELKTTNIDINAIKNAVEALKNKEGKVYFYIPSDKHFNKGNAKYLYDIAGNIANMGYTVFVLQDEDGKEAPPKSKWMANFPENVIHMPFSKAKLNSLDTLFLPELYVTTLRRDFESNNINNIYCEVIAIVYDRFRVWKGLDVGENWMAYNKKTSPFKISKVIVPSSAVKEYLETYQSFSIGLEYIIIPPSISPVFHNLNRFEKPSVSVLCKDTEYAEEFCKGFLNRYPHLSFFQFIIKKNDLQEEYADTLRQCAATVWLNPKSTNGLSALESMACGVPVIAKVPDFIPEFVVEIANNGMSLRNNARWVSNTLSIDKELAEYLQGWLTGVENPTYVEIVKEALETSKLYSPAIQTNAVIKFFEKVVTDKIEKKELIIKKIEQ